MMDYNMLTALQEVRIAEERIIKHDYVGARKKLLQVQIQCHLPAFDNISGMITVCDILHSAGYEFLGCGTDYYWVLEVSPIAGERIIPIQYNKFTTLLELIKNNFPGAASALKIIQDAFAALSNQKKYSAFDMKRATRLQSYVSGNLQEAHAVDSQQQYLLTVNQEETSVNSKVCMRDSKWNQ